MQPYLYLPMLAAFGYAIGAMLTKRALVEGGGAMRVSFVANWIMFAVFVVAFPFLHEGNVDWSQMHWPLLAGLGFFIGQVLTFLAIRMADVSVQAPLMGIKPIFVGLATFLIWREPLNPMIWAGAIISAVAVFLLGFSGFRKEPKTLLGALLAVVSALFFGATDALVAQSAKGFGPTYFSVVMMGTNALLSFFAMPFFTQPLSKIPRKAWPWVIGASLALAIQAVILYLTLSIYKHATEANVVYTSRGLWSIVLIVTVGHWFGNTERNSGSKIMWQRASGAVLITLAIGLVFLG